MFSKTGKITNQKFYILSKKKDILNPNKNFYKVPIFSTSEKVKEILKELIVKEEDEDNMDEEFLLNIDKKNEEKIINIPKKKMVKLKKKKDKTKEPFFKKVSRSKLNYLDNKDKEDVPPLGLYNPKYLFKKQSNFVNYEKNRTGFSKKNNKKELINNNDYSFKPDKPKKKLYGYYNFSKTTNRIGSAHKCPTKSKISNIQRDFDYTDNNFYNKISKNINKTRVPTFNIKKMTPREKYEIKKLELPNYNPNFDFVKKRAGSAVPNFESYIPREELYSKKQYINETLFDYEKAQKNKKNNLFKYQKVPNFKKDLSRKPLTNLFN